MAGPMTGSDVTRLTPAKQTADDAALIHHALLRHTWIWHICHMPVEPSFEWDDAKDRINRAKHGVSFALTQFAFFDPHRVIAEDLPHGETETRYFRFGRVEDGAMTVRFTCREGRIRIFGAGYWRKGKKIYEQQNR
jgi:uncharacterized protein